jgi:hypothetical protein
MRFTKRPTEIEAHQWQPGNMQPGWIIQEKIKGRVCETVHNGQLCLAIITNSSKVLVPPGYYIYYVVGTDQLGVLSYGAIRCDYIEVKED